MTYAESLRQVSYAVAGITLINAVVQAVWNNHSIRKIALFASLGGSIVGTVATIAGLFGLIVPFTYDSPYTWDAPDGIAYQFSEFAKNGALLATISAIAFMII